MKIFPNIYRLLLAACCLLPSGIFAQSTDALSQGLWKVAQVTIEKNTDGKLETTVYNTAAEVQSRISCPQEWEISAQNIVMRYPSGRETTSKYTVDGNLLKIMATAAAQSYRYKTDKENLTLTIEYKYVNNLPTRQRERIEEKWTIILVEN